MHRERAESWIIFAETDLRAAKACLKDEVFNQVCFHAQQMAEKALKAVIAFQGEDPPKIHGLTGLLNKGCSYIKELEGFELECTFLNRFYLPVRYPETVIGFLPKGMPNQQDAAEALQMAEKILNFVKEAIFPPS